MKNEVIKKELRKGNNTVLITTKRIIQFEDNWYKNSFKDLDLNYLQSISRYEKQFPFLLYLSLLGVLFLIFNLLFKTPSPELLLLGLIWFIVFIFCFVSIKKTILEFHGLGVSIKINNVEEDLVEIRELCK